MKRRLLLFLLIAWITHFWVLPASASGPGVGGRRVRLDQEPAGPYLIRAVTSPTPPTVESFNVEVRVTDATLDSDVIDAFVIIKAEPVDFEAAPIKEIATHDFAPLPTEYAAHLPIPQVGLWLVTIEIESELGNGQVSFYQQISNPPNLGALVSVGAPLGGLLLLAMVFFWLQRNSPSSPATEESTDE